MTQSKVVSRITFPQQEELSEHDTGQAQAVGSQIEATTTTKDLVVAKQRPKSSKELAEHKTILLTKIIAERQILSLQTRRLRSGFSAKGIRQSLIEGGTYLTNKKFSSKLLGIVGRYPSISLIVSKFLLRVLSKRKVGVLRLAVLSVASWFVYKKFK